MRGVLRHAVDAIEMRQQDVNYRYIFDNMEEVLATDGAQPYQVVRDQ